MKLSNRVRNIAACLIVGAVLLLAVGNLAYDYVYQQGSTAGSNFGYLAGQKATLTDMEGFLKSGGIAFNWTQQPDGSLTVQLMS